MRRHPSSVVFWFFALLAAISLGVSAGPVFWRILGETGQAVVLPPADASPAQSASRADLNPIIAFSPFGAVAVVEEQPSLVGETSLGLILLGVTIGNPVSASRAIIKAGGDQVQSYSIGANVTDTAQLTEINTDHVVLKVEGRLETLSFIPPGATPSVALRGPDLRNMIPRSTTAAPPSAQSNAPDAVIARYRAAIHQNPQGVMDRLGLELTDRGYRISTNASPGVRQAGFRPGDIVTMVNGQQVGDIDKDREFFDEIAASGRARVELERDGQAIVMTFPLQ